MQYGHFDDANKEYVVTRADTPRSWTNYLGDTTYGGLISNNAGGFAFYRSGNLGRFLRMRTNAVPVDQPGRYVYLRDRESGDLWSSSWQPVGKPLTEYHTECRHGTAYTKITSTWRGIRSESLYFVPLGQTFECWKITLSNTGSAPRKISAFPFVEWANSWNRIQDLENLQYTQYILDCSYHDGVIERAQNKNLPEDPHNFTNDDQGRWNFMTVVGTDIHGFDTDRATVIGPYRSYHNPLVMEEGRCRGSLAQGDNGVGTFQCDIDLKPGESRTFLVLLGVGKASVGKQVAARFGIAQANAAFAELKKHWHSQIGRLVTQTPDAGFNSMINVWNAYNCLITFNWSRAASFVYNGDRDGLGFRDTVQDFMAASILIPDQVRARLLLMLSGVESRGSAMPEVKPYAHKPGSMPLTPEDKIRSDDCMWLFEAVQAYIKETGETSFLQETVPFSDKGTGTVLQVLKRTLEFTRKMRGANGLPCGLHADWNDCLRMGFRGETVFVAEQYRLALVVYRELAQLAGQDGEAAWVAEPLAEIDQAITKTCWDGKWWIRAITDQGEQFGSSKAQEGRIFLNTQSWAVLAGVGSKAQQEQCLDSVDQHLATDYGIQVCDPGYATVPCKEVRAVLFNPGMKENGGIFNHTQGWAVMAACRLGQGDRAWKWYKAFMPASFNDKAEVRQIEPYVQCQSTHSRYSSRFGAGRVAWLTGCATWAYWSATTHILGVQADYDGLRIQPCLPKAWPEVTITRQFRGKQFQVRIINGGAGNTVASITLNGKAIRGNVVPLAQASANNEVVVQLA